MYQNAKDFLVDKKYVQSLRTFVFGCELVVQLFVRAQTLPDALLLLVAHDIVELCEPAEHDSNSRDDDEREVAAAVVRFVTVCVDAGCENAADLDRHVVQAK